MRVAVLLLLSACAAPADDAPTCPEVNGFASYAYVCAEQGAAIYECHADSGVLAMCDQAVAQALTCRCDSLTTCKLGHESVACAKRAP